ncbi:N-acetyl-gamma-glutamyl-phosphate reductase [Sphingomonas astaxanthinifaciens]|uniref:N-acetyl-gamma-glutamyl-phosphate reductase n=1 Tax=Sphingomonas astaxanthinifaciens DSM 22298 TaxID=1123267 RepID=A0ABQ5Z2G3_9SPHN|nr:N-acetyl-gamma-glutamyl-phosphate reductase [Sphingomonas astaxanthinifaciens]GLR46945.1 N-acetyl-gamma-glutamyl-phosphate reductase [Sphingomonas astaxanthinifaciens DSM 22298]
MIRAAILGASGYVGGELLRLLARHPAIAATRLFGDSKAGQKLGQVHPHIAVPLADLTVERFDLAALDGIDLVLAALPHGESQKIAGAILEKGCKLVDLGADFRLHDPQDYAHWYGEPHQAPELLGRFVTGIPEFHRDAIRSAQAVAAAGCYPTATILALKPLVDAGLVDPASIIVDAASGVSGAGRGLKEGTSYNVVEGSFVAYGLLNHRHTAEMEQALGATILFTPHLAPMTRGILATCYATATRDMGPDEPLSVLRSAYADEPFVRVSNEPPATKWVAGSNGAVVTARYDPRTGRVVALGAIDNLGKGAAGQMIQCANLMTGLDEAAGLAAEGVFP